MPLSFPIPITVLFDEPLIEAPNAKLIHFDKTIICCARKLKLSLLLYMFLLVCQYILAFAAVPFDDIENRPPLHLISNFFILFMFCLNICILPIASSSCPNIISFRCLALSLAMEVAALTINAPTMYVCLKTSRMFHEEKIQGVIKVIDFTKYIKIVAASSMILSLLAALIAAYSTNLTFLQISASLKLSSHQIPLSASQVVDGLPPYSIS